MTHSPTTGTEWIDISVLIHDGMGHWPDNPGVSIERVLDMRHGAAANVSRVSLGVHTGTHMDAPIHFESGGLSIDQVPIDAGVGRARVVVIDDPKQVTVEELRAADVRAGERILLRTKNSDHVWREQGFVERFVHLSVEAAEYLVARSVKTVGIDYLSVGAFQPEPGEDPHNVEAVHHALLGGGVWIIEGLDLSQAPAGPCELICLPLKLAGADGAPARAILKPLASEAQASEGERA